MRRKKVLLLITKSNWGGAQRYVFDLAANLPVEKFEVVVALGGNGPLVPKLEMAGVRVVPIPSLTRDISLTQEILASRAIAHIIKQEKPDVLHLNSSKVGALGALIGRLQRVPRVIFTAHGWAFNEDRSWLSRTIIKSIHWVTVLLTHRTITVSDAVQNQMNWPGARRKMLTVHLGRDQTLFLDRTAARHALTVIQPALKPFLEDFWTITIGELHPIKQHELVIEAVASLAQTLPTLRHIIIGSGDLAKQLQECIAEHNLEKHVFLLGHVDEAAQYLPAADIFVLASRSEALGYVVLEATQAGIPVVVSNVGGIPEIITDGVTGTLVTNISGEGFAQAISQYHTQPDMAHTHAAAAKDHATTFSIDAMIAETVKVYE